MDLLNATKMQAGYTMGLRPDGKELLVVCVKGTFKIPEDNAEPALAEKQEPLIEADVFTGKPGLSALRYESDYAPYKPFCDVLLNGSAYAPGGKPAKQITVLMRVDPISKSFNVVGDRTWSYGVSSASPTSPKPFLKMPISYDVAFGGTDTNDKDPANHGAYMENPVGRGFHHAIKLELVEGKSLPNTEEVNNPVISPDGKYRPMSFGPVGRNFQSRLRFAGTYDQNWLDNIFPFLPPDFQDEYYQSAPIDQQMPYPKGGEEVILVNLTPQVQTRFRLPKIEMPVEFAMKNWERNNTEAVIDTIVIEPDENRFMMTWRASMPLRRNMFEVAQVVVGKMPKAWYKARDLGKTYYPSLDELIRSRTVGAEVEE